MAARPRLTAALALALSTAAVLAVTPAGGVGRRFRAVRRARVRSRRRNTPDVKNGVVYSIGQVGSTTLLGGTFTSVAPHGGTGVAHKSIVAFNSSTGVLTSTFAPKLDGEVDAIIPAAGNTAYIAGTFTHVNGKAMHVGLLDVTTGALVSHLEAADDGRGDHVARLSPNGLLFVGGNFTKVGTSSLSGLVALNPTTGALSSPYVDSTSPATTARAASRVRSASRPSTSTRPARTWWRSATSPASPTRPAPTPRDQVFRMNLSATSGTVDPAGTPQPTPPSASTGPSTPTSATSSSPPTGTYFVDRRHRWQRHQHRRHPLAVRLGRPLGDQRAGTDVQPTWVDYTGQDSLWSVAVTGTAVYVGGHQRWVNNSNGYDAAGRRRRAASRPRRPRPDQRPAAGVEPRPQPARRRRLRALATSTGLYVGSDTDYIGNHKYKHQKIAFFPLAGGAAPASTGNAAACRARSSRPASSPTPTPRSSTASTPAARRCRRSTAARTGWPTRPTPRRTATPAATPPAGAPVAQRRQRPSRPARRRRSSTPSAGTRAATATATRCTGTSRSRPARTVAGPALLRQPLHRHQRQPASASSTSRSTARPCCRTSTSWPRPATRPAPCGSFTETSTGDITIDLTHEVENPLINGIEIVQTSPTPPPPTTGDQLLSRHLDTAGNVGASSTANSSARSPWSTVRGAFIVGGHDVLRPEQRHVLQAHASTARRFGAAVAVDPYDDPAWQNVQTGSGQTYAQHQVATYYAELPNVTSAFYSGGRLYYTLFGQSQMYYRYFTPDSGVVGSQEFTVNDGLDWSDTAGAFLSGNTLYYATKSDGVLHSIAWSTDHATGSPTTVDSTQNWAGHGLFATSD